MNFEENIKKIPDCVFHKDHDLTGYTTLRLPSKGDLLEIKSVESLRKILPVLVENKKKYRVVGWGANQILPPNCLDIIIHLDFPFDPTYLEMIQEEYTLPASLGLNHLTSHASRFCLKGWEVFTGIPASLGGAVFMNAGTNLGEIGRLVKKVILVTPQGDLREEVISQDSFSYRKNHFVGRGEVIVGAVLIHNGIDSSIPQTIKEYLEYRKKTQPLSSKNCGCVFKNPFKNAPAGKIIDSLGLKGLERGGLRVSFKHANFIENLGVATWHDFEEICTIVRFYADHFYGIEFELEVKSPYH